MARPNARQRQRTHLKDRRRALQRRPLVPQVSEDRVEDYRANLALPHHKSSVFLSTTAAAAAATNAYFPRCLCPPLPADVPGLSLIHIS